VVRARTPSFAKLRVPLLCELDFSFVTHAFFPCTQTGCGAMIFTLFGYLLLVGIVRRDVRSAITSLVVFVIYGGLLWTLLPVRDRTVRQADAG
jgi:hypothetical protein